jgi:hypothetical protein
MVKYLSKLQLSEREIKLINLHKNEDKVKLEHLATEIIEL